MERGPEQEGSDHRRLLLTVAGLACLYCALASGHFQSIDGMLMFQQARSILYDGSLVFQTPLVWEKPIPTSKYGIGLSLLYLPGLAAFSWLEPWVHQPSGMLRDYFQLYIDPVYAAAGVPLQIGIALASAYLIGRFSRALGLSTRASLWGAILYGVASPALTFARGDYAQPLLGLLWIGGLYAAYRHTRGAGARARMMAALAIFFAILARPLEGMLLLPAVTLVLARAAGPRTGGVLRQAALPVVAAVLGVAVTLAVNYGRYGSPFTTGYGAGGWSANPLVGLAGLLVSPGRGLLWAFPAVVLAPLGARALYPSNREMTIAMVGLCITLLLVMSGWHMWWGGVNWGPRLLVPSLPIMAVLAAAAIPKPSTRLRVRLPLVLAAMGLLWALPTALIDLNVYGGWFDGPSVSFLPRAHPFLFALDPPHTWRPGAPLAPHGIDVVWVRATGLLGPWPLLVLGALLAAAAVLLYRAAGPSAGNTRTSTVRG